MRSAWLTSLLACLIAGTTFADEKVRFDEQNEGAHRTAAFNRAVGALPIDPDDGDQIRAWSYAFWSGEIRVTGYIVTRKGAWRCTLRYTHRREDILVHPGGRCSGPHRYAERIDKVMLSMSDVAKLDGKDVTCEVFDGWGAHIEGIFEGKPFSFTVANTNECVDTNEEARRANEMLELLGGAYSKDDD